ncbi:MAG: hypothetical protein WDM89_05815 [Rhizomicrobium sp.]
MTKRFIALAGACIALVCSSGAWAEMTDAKSGRPAPQQLVQKAMKGPLAFGFIGSDGTVASGSGNFSATVSSGTYFIKIKKVDYFYSSFSTAVTPSLPQVSYCTTDSAGRQADRAML